MLCNESDSILNAFFLPRFSSIRSPNEFHSTFLSPVIVIIVKYHKLKSISYHIPILWNACFFFCCFFSSTSSKIYVSVPLFYTPHFLVLKVYLTVSFWKTSEKVNRHSREKERKWLSSFCHIFTPEFTLSSF